MFPWLVCAIYFLFAAAAYYDWKERRIPDPITALLWCILLFPIAGWDYSLQLPGLALGFAALFLIISIGHLIKKGSFELFGWGDILLHAPFFSVMVALHRGDWYAYTMLLGLVLSHFLYRTRKEALPFALVFLLGITAAIGGFLIHSHI